MPDMLTRREVAVALKISVKTLRRMERDGTGPKPVRLSSRIARYPIAEIAAFAAPEEVAR